MNFAELKHFLNRRHYILHDSEAGLVEAGVSSCFTQAAAIQARSQWRANLPRVTNSQLARMNNERSFSTNLLAAVCTE